MDPIKVDDSVAQHNLDAISRRFRRSPCQTDECCEERYELNNFTDQVYKRMAQSWWRQVALKVHQRWMNMKMHFCIDSRCVAIFWHSTATAQSRSIHVTPITPTARTHNKHVFYFYLCFLCINLAKKQAVTSENGLTVTHAPTPFRTLVYMP